jgi:hypothetical protein
MTKFVVFDNIAAVPGVRRLSKSGGPTNCCHTAGRRKVGGIDVMDVITERSWAVKRYESSEGRWGIIEGLPRKE